MDKKSLIFAIGTSLLGTAIGALTGLGLSVTAFSPLAIGGIIGSIIPAVATIFSAGYLLHKFYNKGFIEEDNKTFSILCSITIFTGAAIGVGLAAAATAISPGIMLGAGSAALTGATIGAIAVIAPMQGSLQP
ncbi:hypothetical protein [Wolbachia endosymbiont (group A) of Agelastica alni]|uniref:hypothetical protein n=1 Tax=Wolbachia endosymbiont (group A) of Agelastica alni TaxID=3066130 RepID=UPI0031330312